MGGGDLNMKKSWHPGLIKNRAQVWEDQHAALQERKRIEALKKEIEAERAENELRALNEAAGGPKRQDRVEFLYAGPGAGGGITEDREAYLLGKKRIDDVLGKDSMGQEIGQAKKPEASLSGGLNLRDVSNKVAMDPLLAIKRQEAAQYEALINKKKAELEVEARKAARRDARGGNKHSAHRSDDRHSSRYDHDSSTSTYRSSHRSSRRDSSRSRERSFDSYKSRDRRRSDSYDRHRSSRTDRDRDHNRYSASHDKPYYRHTSRPDPTSSVRRSSRSPDVSTRRKETHTNAVSSADAEAARKASQLAAMSAAASELDTVRERRLEEARKREEEERTMEDSRRGRAAQLGRSTMLSAHMMKT